MVSGAFLNVCLSVCLSVCLQAIELEKALSDDSSASSLTASLADFYQLKYATTNPKLRRVDSTVRHATIVTSDPLRKERVEMLAKLHTCGDYERPVETGRKISQTSSSGLPCTEESDEECVSPTDKEKYTLLSNPEGEKLEIEESDEEGYTHMYKLQSVLEASPSPETTEEGGGGGGGGGGDADQLYYDECNYNSPRYVPKERANSTISQNSSSSRKSAQTSLSNVGEVLEVPLKCSPNSSLEASNDHHESISEFLGVNKEKNASQTSQGSQEEYLDVLPEEPRVSVPSLPVPSQEEYLDVLPEEPRVSVSSLPVPSQEEYMDVLPDESKVSVSPPPVPPRMIQHPGAADG